MEEKRHDTFHPPGTAPRRYSVLCVETRVCVRGDTFLIRIKINVSVCIIHRLNLNFTKRRGSTYFGGKVTVQRCYTPSKNPQFIMGVQSRLKMVTNCFRKKINSCTTTKCLIIYLFLSVMFGS